MTDNYNDHEFVRELFSFRQSTLTESVDAPYEIAMYHRMQHEIKADSHTQWGKKLHALIISDRCGGRALGLCEYLLTLTDLEVQIAGNSKAIKKAIMKRSPDIVIFVGYQECKENYEILADTKEQHPFLSIMFASVDFVIQSECAEYGIPLMYHCMKPLAEFVRVLRVNLS